MKRGNGRCRRRPQRQYPSPKGGGPIEALTPLKALSSSTNIHHRKAVAPLKLVNQPDVEEHPGHIHHRKAVAPLKHGRRPAGRLRHQDIHHRKAVAPLKHPDNAPFIHDREEYPSPKGGGPIEAGAGLRVDSLVSDDIHHRKAVAPLKLERRRRLQPLQAGISITERRWPH